jgi:CheY-like chemotaxis protein
MNGTEGVIQFLGGQFDLVIVDIWMPEKDGLETLMEIRRNTPEAKVIVMSGGGGGIAPTSHLKRAKELGAVATLTKPFLSCDLLQAVQEATQSRS